MAEFILAIGCEAHDFALIAVLFVADELADHCVKRTQRMRQKNTIEHLNMVALAAGRHGGDKISRTVVAESGSFFPWRAVVRAGNVGNVMLKVMFFKTQLRVIDV